MEQSAPQSHHGPSDDFPVIEGYDIIDLIGRGGMGAVYEALQQSTGRRVAVKLMLERAGATEAARRRFEREVELIARLHHPGIVSVLDSGLHRGRYFYVMEHVEGQPLDVALPPGTCNVRAVLATMAKVARAVEYAHQRGVMHRDLKPTNILVDERGEPRLLDFGLAKAFDPHSLVNLRDSLSEPGQVIGTLGYMAPEQARGAVSEVSVRSDVYALGAIAYELVTGSLPCSIDGPMAIVFHRIENRDPDPASSTRKDADADVDAVLLKALEKSPDKRYATAAELADDIERWLAGHAIRARRTGIVERGVRWTRRNPARAGIIVAVLFTMLALFVAFGQRSGRLRQVEIAEEIDQRLLNVIKTIDPDKAPGLAEIYLPQLSQLEKSLEETPRGPEREAVWRVELGILNKKWKRLDKALENLTLALEMLRTHGSGPAEDVAQCLKQIGGVYFWMGKGEEAERFCREACEMLKALHPEHDSPEVADSLNYLAQALGLLRRFDEAERLQQQAIVMSRARFGSESKELIGHLNNFATLRRWQGDFAGAERLHREALDALHKSLKGKQHRHVATSLRNIAFCRMEQGRLEEVESMLIEARSIAVAYLGPQHLDVALIDRELARFCLLDGRAAEAESRAGSALRAQEESRGEYDPETTATRVLLGRIHTALGHDDEAESDLRHALANLIDSGSARPLDLADARAALGESLLAQKERESEALPLLRDAWEIYGRELGITQPRTLACARLLARALEATGDAESAAALRDRAR